MVLVSEEGDELDNLSCLLCNIELTFNLSDHSVYKSHLRGQHKVTSYDLDKLVYLTLNQNYPQLCRSYENLFGLNSTGIQCCLEPDLQFRNDSSLSEEVGGDSGFFDNFDNNSETSRKRSLSSASSRHESESKRSRVAQTNSEQSEFFPEKTCSNCGQVFEEIFQCQSHLISCLNIKQRRSVGQKKSNVESQLTETTSSKVQNKQKLKVSSDNDKSLPNSQNSRLKENAGNPTKENVGKSPKKSPGKLIVDECQFRCKMCSKVMTMKSRYKHMERKHATTYTQYAVKYGDTTRPKYHLCVICNMKICWVPSDISSHLSSNHSMNLESYVSQYREEITAQKAELKDKLLPVKCEECGKAFTGIQRLRRHTRQNHTKSQNEENISQEKLKSNVSGTSFGCPSRVEERIKTHENWWERYTRQCGKCGLYYEMKSDLVQHIKQDHGIKVVEYTSEHGTVRKHCSFRCEICKQEIKWSLDKIRDHLDSVHYLTLKDYGDRYVNAGISSKSNSEEKLRKVEVNISKLDPKNLAKLKVQDENESENMEVEKEDGDNDNDSNEDEDSVWDYSCLPKQDLGKCVNSIIEDLFKDPSITNFSSPTRPREEEFFDLPYKCATCGFRSRSKHLLKTHIQELHTKMTAIHCCGQAYTTQWNYQVHLESEQHHQSASDHHNLIVPEDVVLPADKFAAESALSVIVGDPQQDHHALDLTDSRSSTPHPVFSSSTQDVILADVEAGQSSHQHPLQQPTTSSSKKRFGHSKIKTIKVLYTEGKSDCSDLVHKRKVLETVGDLVDDQAAADDLVEDLDQDDQGQTMVDPPSEKGNYQNTCDTTSRQLDEYGRGRSGPNYSDDGRGRSVPSYSDDGRGRSGPNTSDDEGTVDMDEMETSEMDTSTEDTVDAMTELREAKEYKIWANQCTMRCEHKDCGFLTHDLIDFRMHTLSVHSQLFEQYQQFIQPNSGSKAKPGTSQGKIWTNLVNVTCELCSTKIVHSQEKIESHMLDTHFITGFQYFKIYIKPFLVVKAELEALREKKGTPPGKNVRKSSQILKELSFN